MTQFEFKSSFSGVAEYEVFHGGKILGRISVKGSNVSAWDFEVSPPILAAFQSEKEKEFSDAQKKYGETVGNCPNYRVEVTA